MNVEKLKWLKWMAFWVVVAVLAVIALDQRMIVRRYTLDAEEITAPVRLAVVTDLHECDYGADGAELLQAVKKEAPDAVLLVGDMFADGGDYSYGLSLMRSLAARWPTYYVTGNHEYWTNEVVRIESLVEESGVTVLNQECRSLCDGLRWRAGHRGAAGAHHRAGGAGHLHAAHGAPA